MSGELSQTARTGSWLSLVGLGVLLLGVAWSMVALTRVQDEVADLESVREDRRAEIDGLLAEVDSLQVLKDSLYSYVAQRATPQAAAAVVDQAVQAIEQEVRRPTVYVQVPAAARDAVRPLEAELKELGFPVPATEVVRQSPSRTQVRVFDPALRREAAVVARAVRQAGFEPRVRVMPEVGGGTDPRARGHVEVWIAADA